MSYPDWELSSNVVCALWYVSEEVESLNNLIDLDETLLVHGTSIEYLIVKEQKMSHLAKSRATPELYQLSQSQPLSFPIGIEFQLSILVEMYSGRDSSKANLCPHALTRWVH